MSGMARVLVLEPDAEIRRLFCQMLTRLGHEPRVLAGAANGAEDCDAVLLEPAWRAGVERARRLAAGPGARPIVAASIHSAGTAAAGLPVVRHLVKPFTLVQLADAIAEALAAGRR